MTELKSWLSQLSIYDPSVWLALGSGFAVIFTYAVVARLRGRAVERVRPAMEAPQESGSGWFAPVKRSDERRRSPRRGGMPTAVAMVDPKRARKQFEGYVLDRSTGGLRLAIEKPYPSGTHLQIRPGNAPEDTPWVTIIVRNCREVGDHYEVGVQFEQDLPWHLLLLFG